jgi:hypothetical protein
MNGTEIERWQNNALGELVSLMDNHEPADGKLTEIRRSRELGLKNLANIGQTGKRKKSFVSLRRRAHIGDKRIGFPVLRL